jgi:hypothetical protein
MSYVGRMTREQVQRLTESELAKTDEEGMGLNEVERAMWVAPIWEEWGRQQQRRRRQERLRHPLAALRVWWRESSEKTRIRAEQERHRAESAEREYQAEAERKRAAKERRDERDAAVRERAHAAAERARERRREQR